MKRLNFVSGLGLSLIVCLAGGTALIGPAQVRAAQNSQVLQSVAAPRIAIVIGNQDYENVEDLGNTGKDARDIAAMLRDFDYKVFDGYDLNKREFEELLRTAVLNIREEANVVFYYAGHGIQIGRRNYLLPVDSKFESIYDLPLETMTLDRVIDTLAVRGAAHVAIIDSCRANPFQGLRLAADLDANLFETRSGFDVFRTPLNSLVAFSTSPGALALDGEPGGNSPYTEAVLSVARAAPAENLLQLFPSIRERVHAVTQGAQVPWESSTLVRPFALAQLTSADRIAQTDAEAPVVTLSVSETFDRRISLDAAIGEAIGTPVSGAVLVDAPENGLVMLGDGVNYAPEIADIRALDVTERSVTDQFSVEVTGADGAARRVEVALELEYDECDLQAGDALDLNGVGVFRLPNDLDMEAGLRACTAALEREPDKARWRYQLGRLQQVAARVDDAYDSFAAAEAAGHIRAKFGLAVLLDTQRLDRAVTSVPYDLDRALALLEEGVTVQDPYAMHRLGQRLMRHGETEAEQRRGFELLERSVELGHTYAMNELGFYFLSKSGDRYIPERGMRYLQASQMRGDIYGYNNLGFVALNGLDGNPPDYEKALEFFQAAADGGHPNAPANIARMILRGQLGEPDTAEALRLYDMSLERGDGWGGANGAYIILNGDVRGRGPADAAVRAAKAAHLSAEDAAQNAQESLAAIGPQDLNKGMQMVLNELGANIAVDGQVGPATLRALEEASAASGVPLAFGTDSEPKARLLQAARVYWARNPVRFDLF